MRKKGLSSVCFGDGENRRCSWQWRERDVMLIREQPSLGPVLGLGQKEGFEGGGKWRPEGRNLKALASDDLVITI